MKYNRSQIMRDAHRRRKETGAPFSECLKTAWAYAKTPKQLSVKPKLILPPTVQAAKSAIALAKKLKTARIELAGRVHVDLGIRITPKGETAMAYVVSKELSGGFDRPAL